VDKRDRGQVMHHIRPGHEKLPENWERNYTGALSRRAASARRRFGHRSSTGKQVMESLEISNCRSRPPGCSNLSLRTCSSKSRLSPMMFTWWRFARSEVRRRGQ